jgi:hypothetical protein
VDQAYDGWRVVSEVEFQQWVESGYSNEPPECRRCANRDNPSAGRHRMSIATTWRMVYSWLPAPNLWEAPVKVQHRLVLACAALLFGSYAPPGFAEEVQCLRQVQSGAQPGVWETIKNYFASLSLTNKATINRSPLIQLRAAIIDFEIEKQRLIEIVEAHINEGASGAVVSDDLRLSKIPDALAQIDIITQQLERLAKDENLFVAENSFRDLKFNFDAKRAKTLCALAQAESGPNVLVMTTLVQELKDELKAISGADEALGKYIRESIK